MVKDFLLGLGAAWGGFAVLVAAVVGFVLGMLVQGQRHTNGIGRLVPALANLDRLVRRLAQYAATEKGSPKLALEVYRSLSAIWAAIEGRPAPTPQPMPEPSKVAENGAQELPGASSQPPAGRES